MNNRDQQPNPYAVGAAVDIGTDDVTELFDSQSAMGALLGGAGGAIISVVCFEAIAVYLNAQIASTGLILIGVIVGLSVRVLGRGFELMYRLIAVYFTFVAQVWLVLRVIVLWFGLATLSIGMLAVGLVLAGALCVRSLDQRESVAAWRARHLGNIPEPRFVNTWAFVATLMLLTGAPLVYIVSSGILWLIDIQIPWLVLPGILSPLKLYSHRQGTTMITVHHLQNSRSQRILWMLEELGVEYVVKRYERDPETQLAPPELLDVHPLGKSPILEDGEARVAESGAIIEFLGKRYGRGSMVPAEDTAAYREYIYWLHYAEGSLMTPLLLRLVFERIKTTKMPFFAKPIARGIADKVMGSFVTPNLVRHMQFVDDHLAKHTWFAGDTLTGADVQMSFPLEASVARGAVGDKHKNILSYVGRIHARPAYQAALEKGGPYDYA